MPGAKDFRDGPGLSNAAARSERGVAIENLAEGAESVRIHLLGQRLEEAQCRVAVPVHAKVREHERPK